MKKILLGFVLGVSAMLLIAAGTLENYIPKKNTAEVAKQQNLYIYTDCSPVMEYEYLGTVKGKAISWAGTQYEPVRDMMIKLTKKQYPDAEGIILYLRDGGIDYCDAIKFK